MSRNPDYFHRRSIRLKGYDYSQEGLYFITICVQNRACLFGNPVGAHPCGRPDETDGRPDETDGRPDETDGRPDETDGRPLQLNAAGKMIEKQWLALIDRFHNIQLHEYVIMPNHFHCILEIVANGQNRQPQGHAPRDAKTVGDMMDAFKSITTVEYIRSVKQNNWTPFDGKLWQRNYYEHIIRTPESYENIANYIVNNPSKWNEDKFHIE